MRRKLLCLLLCACITLVATGCEENLSVDESSQTAERSEMFVSNVDADTDALSAEEICYGSVLSYYSNWPPLDENDWISLTREYQTAALSSKTGIPYIYGNDFLHGINMCDNNIIFPHNINLGAANDIELTYDMGAITGSNMIHR